MILAIINAGTLILLVSFLLQLKRKQIQLGHRIIVSLCCGVVYGFMLKLLPVSWPLIAIKNILTLMGDGYLALLKMLVIPLILTSIIHAILSLGNERGNSIKKISFITCAMLLSMTAASSLIAIIIGKFFGVGQNLSLPALAITPDHVYTGLVDTLLGMLPSNPVAVMSQGNTVAIVLFAVFIGFAARMLEHKDHDKLDLFKNWVSSLFVIVKKLAVLVLGLTPYGILGLVALMVLSQGTTLLAGMFNFTIAMYTAMFLVIVMHCTILLLVRQNPWTYLKTAYPALFIAFTTRSSFGTLPVTEDTLRDKFNISQMVATFVPSIGATIGMNACAGVFPAMLVVMTLNIMHLPLTPYLIYMVMFINSIASLGISGIPGTAYIAATVTLTSLNLPYAIVGLVQGIDPIIDMGRTATNVSGAMTTALVVEEALLEDTQMTNSEDIAECLKIDQRLEV